MISKDPVNCIFFAYDCTIVTIPDTHQLEDVDSQHKKDVDRFISDLAKKDRSSQKLSTIINHNKQVARSRSPPPADPRRRISRDGPAASSKDRGPRNMVKDGQAPGGDTNSISGYFLPNEKTWLPSLCVSVLILRCYAWTRSDVAMLE